MNYQYHKVALLLLVFLPKPNFQELMSEMASDAFGKIAKCGLGVGSHLVKMNMPLLKRLCAKVLTPTFFYQL